MNPYPEVILKPQRERPLLRGHPWVFSGAVREIKGDAPPGAVARLCDAEGKALALGFLNPASDIVFRVLTRKTTSPIDDDFWRRRLAAAAGLRRRIVPPETTAFRLVNAEGDGLPGLVVDIYGDFAVVSLETAGMEGQREGIIRALRVETAVRGIYERSEGHARRREGLKDRVGPLWGETPPENLEIKERGLRFLVSVVSGQKTGFFLDQRPNRRIVERLAAGGRVLNGFSYTGAFSVYACRGGAARTVSVEASPAACETALENLRLNGFDPSDHPVIRADMFGFLRTVKEPFDLVILDPPAFAPSRGDLPRALRGYKEINLQAFRILRKGGILATFSCSNAVGADIFERVVLQAASDARVRVSLLARLGPGADHPVNLAHPEGRYLKGLLLSVQG